MGAPARESHEPPRVRDEGHCDDLAVTREQIHDIGKRRAWVIWGVGLSIYLLAVFHRSSLGVAGLLAAERFNVDATQLALFTVLQLAVYAGMQVPVGVLLDRFGSRAMLLAGLVLMTAGQLTFAFVDPAEAGKWAHEYYEIIKSEECVPIGHTVNANVAMVTGFSCHADFEEAKRRGAEGFQFFGYSLGHFYVYGNHQPGTTDVWQRFEKARSYAAENAAKYQAMFKRMTYWNSQFSMN